jgi:hypothetical protein
MTTFFGVSGPLGCGKTTAAIGYSGYAAQAGEKFIIAQPSKMLLEQSVAAFHKAWPNIGATSFSRDTHSNVSRAISDHTKAASVGQVMFTTHAALTQSPYIHDRTNWHLIVDEAPAVIWNHEYRLKVNHLHILSAIEARPFNAAYSVLEVSDPAVIERISKMRGQDDLDTVFSELADKLLSSRWTLYVLSEQFERFNSGQLTDGKLSVFGLLDHQVFSGFATSTFMSANLCQTIAHRLFVEQGCSFSTHKEITSGLTFHRHENGNLLTVYYAMNGRWSKHRRDQITERGETIGQLIINEAKALFGTEEFVWQTNIDLEKRNPFSGTNGVQLPHMAHGLNEFRDIHNAVVIPALNPSPALYGFLDQIAHIDPDEVHEGIYHESVYQTAGRISTRNPADRTPKRVIVADQAAAEMLVDLYPGAKPAQLPCVADISPSNEVGRKRQHESDSTKKKAYRARVRDKLLAELATVNSNSASTKLPNIIGQNVDAKSGYFGGSIWSDVCAKSPLYQVHAVTFRHFVEFLRELHMRQRRKGEGRHWSPAVFKPTGDTDRAIADIESMCGLLLDGDDGSQMAPQDFADLLPHVSMVIYNTASSTPEKPKYRVVIPTTCLMTPAVHEEIVRQIKEVLRRKGFFDKHQLQDRAERGLGGTDHGFEWKHSASMYSLPAQAEAGPEASFFYVFDGGKRRAIDPFAWIDRTIINHQPPVVPEIATISPERLNEMMQEALENVLHMMEPE